MEKKKVFDPLLAETNAFVELWEKKTDPKTNPTFEGALSKVIEYCENEIYKWKTHIQLSENRKQEIQTANLMAGFGEKNAQTLSREMYTRMITLDGMIVEQLEKIISFCREVEKSGGDK